jgi:putative transposase
VPRKPRENVAGAVYHAYARGNNRGVVFRDTVDRQTYVEILAGVVIAKRWRCLAYCLMTNHVHLLLETPEPNLGAGMQRLHSRYAQIFNARHGQSGHVFQGRYGVVRMKSDEQLCATAAYIARNPVEAKLCRRPEDWLWSSYHHVVEDSAPTWLDTARLLSYFARSNQPARRAYADLSAPP